MLRAGVALVHPAERPRGALASVRRLWRTAQKRPRPLRRRAHPWPLPKSNALRDGTSVHAPRTRAAAHPSTAGHSSPPSCVSAPRRTQAPCAKRRAQVSQGAGRAPLPANRPPRPTSPRSAGEARQGHKGPKDAAQRPHSIVVIRGQGDELPRARRAPAPLDALLRACNIVRPASKYRLDHRPETRHWLRARRRLLAGQMRHQLGAAHRASLRRGALNGQPILAPTHGT